MDSWRLLKCRKSSMHCIHCHVLRIYQTITFDSLLHGYHIKFLDTYLWNMFSEPEVLIQNWREASKQTFQLLLNVVLGSFHRKYWCLLYLNIYHDALRYDQSCTKMSVQLTNYSVYVNNDCIVGLILLFGHHFRAFHCFDNFQQYLSSWYLENLESIWVSSTTLCPSVK